MYRFAVFLALLLSSPYTAFAQSNRTSPIPAVSEQESGLVSYIDFGGSSNAGGRIFTLGLSAGYEFNRHVSINTRAPFYFVSATPPAAGNGGTTILSGHGIGDPSVSVLLSFPQRVFDYKTSVTTWVPVASVRSGFSTGSVLVDWASRVRWRMGDRLVPFGQLDVANTVPDTPLFVLPYTARGFNTRFEAGTNVGLTKNFTAGGSFYYVLPFGQQHVYSRVCDSGSGSGGTTGGTGWNEDGWMTQQLTVGNDLTRDHGFSTWLSANLPHYVDFEIGYTRSYGYNLNTVSFGVGFDLVEALRHRHE
jgi:hypothetical protein